MFCGRRADGQHDERAGRGQRAPREVQVQHKPVGQSHGETRAEAVLHGVRRGGNGQRRRRRRQIDDGGHEQRRKGRLEDEE